MAEFSRVILTEAKRPALKLCWKDVKTRLGYRYFAVWENGKLRRVPIASVRRRGRRWIASGVLETKTGTWRAEDTLTPHGNTLVIDRTWRYRGGRIGSVRLGLDVEVPFSTLDFWAIPYISMNGNPGSRTVPTGLELDGKPWTFREERTTAPGLMTLESDGVVAGSYTEPGRSERTLSACCILPGKRAHTLRTFFPFRESPCTFLGAGFPGNSGRQQQGIYVGGSGPSGFVVEGDAQFRRRFFVVLDRASAKRHGYVRVWESAWRHLREPMAEPVVAAKTERRLWKSLDHFWFEKGTARGYSLRIDRDGDPLGGFSPVFCTSWGGPTFMLAWLGLRRALRSRRLALAERPLQAAEFFIHHAPRKNGVFRTHFDLRDLTWKHGDLNAVQLGGAAYWTLRCVELLEKTTLFARRVDAAEWRTFALDFCDRAVRTQFPNGAFGSHWTRDGKCLGAERAMGVHPARAVLEAHRHTGRADYLGAAERAARFYTTHIVNREAGYGDCTDILNTTNENDAAGVPDFFIDLYRVTGKTRHLDTAVRAAEFCLSFTFTYNLHFPSETECARRRMRTRGFPAISPETAFVCWFFSPQANAFLDLWKETGDARWKEYAAALVRASLQMQTEPGDTFGLAKQLVGCRAEVIPVLDTVKGGHVWKQGMTGYTWHQPVWWPAAFNLLNFAFIRDRFPGFLSEIEP